MQPSFVALEFHRARVLIDPIGLVDDGVRGLGHPRSLRRCTMTIRLDPPLLPRAGNILFILIICRISTEHQDKKSLEDQEALLRRYLVEHYDGPVNFVVISSKVSGEALDGKELARAMERIRSEQVDVVLVEDLGRICRRIDAYKFCEIAIDNGVRVVAINDHVDTARKDWQLPAIFGVYRHEAYNRDTSSRICRSLRNRFVQGGVVQTLPYGYQKPAGAESDADVQKDPTAEPVYAELFRQLEAGASFCEVAGWMNAHSVPTGGWMRSERWDGRSVARLVYNPILKGARRRNERKSQRTNEDGNRTSVKAPPEQLLLRNAPHLAFVEELRYDRLIAKLKARNAACARGRKAGTADGRAGVAKKRTVWPGQHVVCGVCGKLFYWGGQGQPDRLMCSGTREYACWNAATFNGALAGRSLAEAVLSLAEGLPDFDDVFLAKVEAAAMVHRSAREEILRRLDRDLDATEKEVSNLTDAFARVGYSEALAGRLAEAEAQKARLRAEREDLLGQPDEVPDLPPVAELKRIAREEVGQMAFDDPDYGRLMHRLVSKIEVFPYRLIDGGAVVLRAKITVNLAPLLGRAGGSVGDLFVRTAMVDLFDPVQRAAFREQIIILRQEMTERKAAKQLGLTITATQAAMSLHRQMKAAGLTDPYQPLHAPPDGEKHFQRHKHPRYDFLPLDGYPAWDHPDAT